MTKIYLLILKTDFTLRIIHALNGLDKAQSDSQPNHHNGKYERFCPL